MPRGRAKAQAARLGWPGGYGHILCGDDFFEASIAFTREARAFDPELPLDGLWQALRNVWIGNTLHLLLDRPIAVNPGLRLDGLWQALRNVGIGNTLQLLLDRPVTLRPGLFAYSMLYPLTDNLLDDPGLDGGSKREFNERFGRRLAGLPGDARRRARGSRLPSRGPDRGGVPALPPRGPGRSRSQGPRAPQQ